MPLTNRLVSVVRFSALHIHCKNVCEIKRKRENSTLSCWWVTVIAFLRHTNSIRPPNAVFFSLNFSSRCSGPFFFCHHFFFRNLHTSASSLSLAPNTTTQRRSQNVPAKSFPFSVRSCASSPTIHLRCGISHRLFTYAPSAFSGPQPISGSNASKRL